MAHQTILSPEEPKPRVPLSKATVAVLLGLVVVLALLGSMWRGGDGPQTDKSTLAAVEKDPAVNMDPVVVGTNAAIDSEQAKSEKAIRPLPLTKPTESVVPEQVTRKDNSAVLVDNAARDKATASSADAAANLEKEMQARSAKSVVIDVDDKSALTGLSGATRDDNPDSSTADQNMARFGRPAREPSALEKLAEKYANTQPGASNKSWLQEYANNSGQGGRKVLKPYETNQNLILHQGMVIPAVLGRKINSDMPGRITASTTSNIYDSLGKRVLLIPKGTKLIGSYDSGVQVGQERILFAFERLIMPNGRSIDLPAANGSDMQGAAGVGGDVNNHFFKIFTTSLFIAVIADQTRPSQSSTNVGTSGISDAAGQVLADTSKAILERNRNIAPTITIDQGTRLNVEVVADMVFPSAYQDN